MPALKDEEAVLVSVFEQAFTLAGRRGDIRT
jgi:hypothetical protein